MSARVGRDNARRGRPLVGVGADRGRLLVLTLASPGVRSGKPLASRLPLRFLRIQHAWQNGNLRKAARSDVRLTVRGRPSAFVTGVPRHRFSPPHESAGSPREVREVPTMSDSSDVDWRRSPGVRQQPPTTATKRGLRGDQEVVSVTAGGRDDHHFRSSGRVSAPARARHRLTVTTRVSGFGRAPVLPVRVWRDVCRER